MATIKVNLKERTYHIVIGEDFSGLGRALKKLNIGKKILVITNPTVKRLYFNKLSEKLKVSGFEPLVSTIGDGEKFKNIDSLKKLYIDALGKGIDRSCAVIALGGGVVGDVAGFFAATYMRGLPLVQVPTTLLAMVDSSVGGKTGVDLAQGKNLVGAFYQPKLVWINVRTLDTLPKRQLVNGFAEVIKYGIILDGTFFNYLDKLFIEQKIALKDFVKIVSKCCELKARVVEKDEFEKKGIREILNFGHTFGHALETYTGYKSILHGEAVAVGMARAASAAKEIGLLNELEYSRIKNQIKNAGLSVNIPFGIRSQEILRLMFNDKKTLGGALRLILPEHIGKVSVFRNVPVTVILKSLSTFDS